MKRLKAFLYLLRPYQWYKNLLVFIALLFSFNLFNVALYPAFLLGFLLLCLTSSVSYIVNDIKDVEKDKFNPEKKNRPLPSSLISRREASLVAISLFGASFYISLRLSITFTFILLVLFATNQAYTFWLKSVIIADTITMALGYVWRALAGIALLNGISHPPLSAWFVFGIFFVAMLLATGKRKAELVFLGSNAGEHRAVLNSYCEKVLDYQLTITSSSIVLFYTMYSMNAPVKDLRLIVTIPVVVYGVGRYLYLLSSNNPSPRKPEKLFHDFSLLSALVAWVVLTIIMLYFYPFPFELG